MKKIIALFILAIGFFNIEGMGQSQKVKILRIEVDSKIVKPDFQLYLHKDGRKIIPVRDGNSFEVPADLGDSPVAVQILLKGYDLWFSPVYPSKFTTNWIIGVDKKPFESNNLGTEKSADIKLIYFIQFVSDVGDSTELVVTEKKKKGKIRK